MKCPNNINEYLKGVDAFDRSIVSFSNISIIASIIFMVFLISDGILPYYKYVCNPVK